MNLKPKMFLLVIGSLIVALTALSVPIYWYTRSALEEELDKRLLGMLELSAQLLDADMLGVLSEEPALGQVRLEVERTLQRSVIQDIAGMAVFSSRHTILASTDPPPVEEGLLFSTIDLALQASDSHSVVSNLYRAKKGGYLKTAARSIPTTGSRPVVLVVYGNAASMEYIDQLAGTIFWVVAITLVLAVALTLTFSQSLIRPVQQLSQYAKAIQRDLHTAPVRLQRSDELGDLSQALAEMHAEIKENEAYSRQMLSGIAHEIKNPLGGMEI
ncbi:MAG: HAMP domain-containing protein, partial [Calditrichota bacterium]